MFREQLLQFVVWDAMEAQDCTRRNAWYCLRALPRLEQIAANHLRTRVGVEVFAPQIAVRRPSASARRLLVQQPLFPGYLFARFHYAQQLRHVVSTQGVAGVLKFGGDPSTVADGVIDFLRREIHLADSVSQRPFFAVGTKVTVVDGCFRHIEGRVISCDSATDRVRVLLTLLGQDVQVSVLSEHLVTAEMPDDHFPAGLRRDQNARHQFIDHGSICP